MIIRPRPTLFQLFYVMRGSVVPRIAPQIIGFALYASLIVAAVRLLRLDISRFSLGPFTVLGVALSIYLGFRNNAAYERWWEARKLWGALVYEVRNLARAVRALLPAGDARIRHLLMLSLAFCHHLRASLRSQDAGEQVRGFIGGEADAFAGAANRPDAVLRRMEELVADWRRAGLIDPIGLRILDERIASMAAVQAGCERILGTPLPFAYTLLLHRSAYVFCALLPFGLLSVAGWGTPLFTALVAYSFFGLDALSGELEEPFGIEHNDLPLDSLCRVCEISVYEALGETPPPPLPPTDFLHS